MDEFNVTRIANEIRYTNKENELTAKIEYNGYQGIIKITEYKSKGKEYYFTAKDHKEIDNFWGNLIWTFEMQKLKPLDHLMDEMRERFNGKN